METQQESKTAVIIGGSIAGLLTARVLADRFDEVIIIERDRFPEAVENRKGVPQGSHAHALLGQGRQIMERLFPGLTGALIEQGAPLGHGQTFSGGGYLARHPLMPPTLYVSRPCLEAEVRRRVRSLPNVRLIERGDVTGLMTGLDDQRVTGVHCVSRQAESSSAAISAALVVDAGGRGSRTPSWLEALGYPQPRVEIVEVDMGYASRIYARRPEHLNGRLGINIAPTPDNRRAAGMLAQEGNRWLVTLAGYFGDYPPLDDGGFQAFARKLPTRDVAEVIRCADPLSEPVAFKFPANQRRHYEALSRYPQGLLVIGDALCSFTPIYGQGMSVAAMEAAALQDCLAEGQNDLARRFFHRASKAIDNAWRITVGNDRRLSGITPAAHQRWLSWYMGRLQTVARRDPELALAFHAAANLFAPAQSLLHPKNALRVFLDGVRHLPHHVSVESGLRRDH